MSPAQFHAKIREVANNNNNNNALCPPPLKINKESHFIKKSSSLSSSPPPSSSSSSSTSFNGIVSAKPQQQRHPVIIYTHSPKIIHTHPRDFMALVQKLTGLSRSDDHNKSSSDQAKQENGNAENDKGKMVGNEDNESSSVVTDENNSSSNLSDGQVNSCNFMAPPTIFEAPPRNAYMTNIPMFTPAGSADFLCANQQFFNYTDPLLFAHNRRNSITSSSPTLEGINEFHEF